MKTSLRWLAAAAVVSGVWPLTARAQLMPEGHPPGEHPWALAHYFVWHDGYGWHLRMTTEGQYHQFSGWVDAPGGLSGIVPVVPGTPLTVNWRQVQFNVGVQGGENGFDWQQAGPCAKLLLVQDSAQQPWGVDIGMYSGHPPSYAPFDVCAGAPVAAPPVVVEQAPPPEQQPVDVETPLGPEIDPAAFQSVLAPYGSWVDLPPYGLVWRPYPSAVGPNFMPYGSAGNWTYSDAGWLWNSDYPWGWAPFHYGSWVYADGWSWIPGSVWAPAWVSWRYGDGVVGWAPLGPGGQVVENVHYVFCEPRFLVERRFREHLIFGARAVEYERRVPVITSIRYEHGRPIVPVRAGPPPREIERAVGHPIRPVALSQLSRRAMPPRGVRGVRYPPGASASHPFVRQTVRIAPQSPRPELNRPQGGPEYSRPPERPMGQPERSQYQPPGEQRPMGQPERPQYQPPGEQRPMGQPERPQYQPPGEQRPMAQPERPQYQPPGEQRPMAQPERPQYQPPGEQRPMGQPGRPQYQPPGEQRPMERPAAAPRPPPPPPPRRPESPPPARSKNNKKP